MTSLAQEIRDLKYQLKFVEEIRSEWEQDKEWEQGMTDLVKHTKKQLVDLFGLSLHRLEKFDPDEKAVEKVVKKIPSCLSVFHEGRLPIHSAASENSLSSLKYIPLLAREGAKHNIGGEGCRGGLLQRHHYFGLGHSLRISMCLNGLIFKKHSMYPEDRDRLCVEVLKKLKAEGLILKKDIFDHNLLRTTAKNTLKFFLKWDPHAIEKYFKDNDYPMLLNENLDDFKTVLEVMLECYPHEAGFLFQKDSDGVTAFEYEMEENEFGEDVEKMMQSINSILSPECSFPILHHALVALPKYRDAFMEWFPWAYNLKDHNGRSLTQAILAAGAKCVKDNVSIFASMSDDQIRTKDPVTTLYPFAAVASGEEGDLQKCFYLLRRQPGVLDPWSTVVLRRPRSSSRQKKRKRAPSVSSS